jgi:hypothetical protein
MRSNRLLKTDASPSGRDGHARETDAGNANSGAARATLASLVAGTLLLLGLCLAVVGCSVSMAVPWKSDNNTGSAVIINQAVYQLQAALGLADGAIAQSAQPPLLADSDVALRWIGGRADVDLTSGHIRAILIDTGSTKSDTASSALGLGTTPATPTTTLSSADLDEEAQRLLGLLGWDAASLETQGFTVDDSKTVTYQQVGSVFEKSWMGHDPEGVPNQGILQVGLDVTTGDLHSFLCVPGPGTSLDVTKTITKDQAIKTAKDAAAKSSFLLVSTTTTTPTTTAPSSTTTTVKSKSKKKTTTTATPTTAKPTTTTTVVGGGATADLVHMDDARITDGKDLLVWVVKLAADPKAGTVAATIYVDAFDNKALQVMPT